MVDLIDLVSVKSWLGSIVFLVDDVLFFELIIGYLVMVEGYFFCMIFIVNYIWYFGGYDYVV